MLLDGAETSKKVRKNNSLLDGIVREIGERLRTGGKFHRKEKVLFVLLLLLCLMLLLLFLMMMVIIRCRRQRPQ
jgi:hypothetical protein